ncbi:hypothetical protein [Streptomyces flavofungini]|uniref:hypothetical protein n=1 Tax=Streptomyces flavofungini TaxID=68200 RepID=UPI0025AF9B3E|nr:hypothetical protein [Streptomyces flavofungini]WJV46919.1 hypothetical protein QUY26_16115 [Streptomyces flavofungini]
MSSDHSAVYEALYVWTPIQILSGAWKRRLVALRVDERGVTLGGAPAKYERHKAFVPWSEIESVVLWSHKVVGADPMRYVGVRCKPGTSVLPGPNARLSREQTTKLAPHVSHELFLASRAIAVWTLDPHRLAEAVGAFAPGVPVETLPDIP